MGGWQSTRQCTHHHNLFYTGPSSWQPVFSTTLERWCFGGKAGEWGFDPKINFCIFTIDDYVQPWSTNGQQFLVYACGQVKDKYYPARLAPGGDHGKGDYAFIVDSVGTYQNKEWCPVVLPKDCVMDDLLTFKTEDGKCFTGLIVIVSHDNVLVLQVIN